MPKTRDNHYVPQWYQREFLEPGKSTLALLDLQPEQHTLPDGRIISGKSSFTSPPSRCFYQTDLYSTFFGASVDDEIERRLFGAIDKRGADAVRAFQTDNQALWHTHFEALFEYLDAQKLRTSKGLAWLQRQYPALSQNELMMEMQGIRYLHCTIWTEGVREIVSAKDSDVKFIVTDHPVTIYNRAIPPSADGRAGNDPSIALKGSQTIFPLGRDHCLILTNLEYAKDHNSLPQEKRTFARHFRQSMVNTINFIRARKLTAEQVSSINCIMKASARRYVAAGRREWLSPEGQVGGTWEELGQVLLPPDDGLWHFGGELYAKFENGDVHYQDAFGRTEKERKFLCKSPRPNPKPKEACGCGSGKAFRDCCLQRPKELRPSWAERSIRERNLSLYNGIIEILGLGPDLDWIAVRRTLTDKQIADCYLLFEALWPRETDLLSLLPKPDGRPRAVYTGSVHPEMIEEFAYGASLCFGELIIEHPFTHPGAVSKEYSPTENPGSYHLEFLKSAMFLLNIMPLVDLGLVNLVPDPCTFDLHLRDQMMNMAQARTRGVQFDRQDEPRLEALAMREYRRVIMMGPRDTLVTQIRDNHPNASDTEIEEALAGVEQLKEADPLIALNDGIFGGGPKGGQLQLFKLAPNFEMAMYLAQATGAAIVTDSPFRWKELCFAQRPRFTDRVTALHDLATVIEETPFFFPSDAIEVAKAEFEGVCEVYPKMLGQAYRYLARLGERASKPNWEAQIKARFEREHRKAQSNLRKRNLTGTEARMECLFSAQGIQDNTVNRLLLMSSSEHHMQSVPMAFFIESK
jgi:hypothetical protein